MTDGLRMAPGWPGIDPRWTTANKSAVGTAIGDGSRVWFTASHGILNEIYYPEVDTACMRDAGLLITAGDGFFSEEKRDCSHAIEWLAPGIPAFRMLNVCNDARYEIEKMTCASPNYDAVLQQMRFTPHKGMLSDYRLVLIVSPHLGNHGAGNTGWIGKHKGHPALFAQRESLSMAVVCSAQLVDGTAGFVGDGDAWHDVKDNGRITRVYDRAENGNIALAAEIELMGSEGLFTIAVGFGADPETAAMHARSALLETYEDTERRYVDAWRKWQHALQPLDEPIALTKPHLYRASTAVMKSHMSMNCDGGAIASLSVPWGSSQGDGNLGGYHLVWPRDMVETAGGLLAAGAHDEMKSMLRFLAVTQESDGHWPQNMWLNGSAFWGGIQLDEAAFPILLVDQARREKAIDAHEVKRGWPMVQRAAVFVATHGPSTEQDRWEENAGYSPFTLAVEISALLCGADLADLAGQNEFANYLRDTADDWNASVEQFTYATGTELAKRIGVDGYYVRIGSSDAHDASAPTRAMVPVKNREGQHATISASELVSTDALALVRFGLRDANDPRMLNTVKVIDALLRSETNTGPTWLRYNEDGYGEYADGRPFDGTGIGRGWPLLAGERAHYELAAGNIDEAIRLAAVMRAQASSGAFLPEQVWNAPDIPERELFNGEATGSAMPLVWAHAEYVKVLRSLHEGRLFDCPPQTQARYLKGKNVPRVTAWRASRAVNVMPVGRVLRVDANEQVSVHWTTDNWTTTTDTKCVQLAPNLHVVELPTSGLAVGAEVKLTLYWPDQLKWQGQDYVVRVVE
ncbi:MAG: glycoside hydrolase family 15 protein [Gemmatimonadaceae bacterium]